MDMLRVDQIADANLIDRRILAQGLRARYVIDDVGMASRGLWPTSTTRSTRSWAR